MLVDK